MSAPARVIGRRVCQCALPKRTPLRPLLPSRSRIFTRARTQGAFEESAEVRGGRAWSPKTRTIASAAGLSLSLLATYILIHTSGLRLDAPPDAPSFSSPVLPNPDDHPIEQIPTGTSTIPTFPKTIHLPATEPADGTNTLKPSEEEYQLIGLGIRTVSFLGIQVYVVGLYIAVSDIDTLQQRLIRLVDPVATALVPGEREKLKKMLLDPEKGSEVWNEVIKQEGIRTTIRIVPTRNTDFMHLRDGWVRGITGRTQQASQAGNKEFDDQSFGESVRDFKGIFGGGARKTLPKGQTLLLSRNAKGALVAWYDEANKPLTQIGGLTDERISRLVWLGYLGGKTVASESARQSVVDGVMDFVERPIGTVATQVV